MKRETKTPVFAIAVDRLQRRIGRWFETGRSPSRLQFETGRSPSRSQFPTRIAALSIIFQHCLTEGFGGVRHAMVVAMLDDRLTWSHALDMKVILGTSSVYKRQDRCCDRSRGIVQPGTNDCCGGHSFTTAEQVSYMKHTDRVQMDLDVEIRR